MTTSGRKESVWDKAMLAYENDNISLAISLIVDALDEKTLDLEAKKGSDAILGKLEEDKNVDQNIILYIKQKMKINTTSTSPSPEQSSSVSTEAKIIHTLRDEKKDEQEASMAARLNIIKGLSYLKAYPNHELYRLVVDGKFHRNEMGWYGYNRRGNGSVKFALNGIGKALTDIDDFKLSEQNLLQIHKQCSSSEDVSAIAGQFRREGTEPVGFGISPNIVTKEGILEIINMIDKQKDYPEFYGSWIGPYDSKEGALATTSIHYHSLKKLHESGATNNEIAEKIYDDIVNKRIQYHYRAPLMSKELKTEMRALFESFNTQMADAKNQDEKIPIIVDLIYQLEHMHPFDDANIRSIVVGLLTRILVQHGFPPATFMDPNIFDTYSKEQLAEELKRALQNSKDLISTGVLFDFDSKTIPAKLAESTQNPLTVVEEQLQETYTDMSSEFSKQLESEISKITQVPVPKIAVQEEEHFDVSSLSITTLDESDLIHNTYDSDDEPGHTDEAQKPKRKT